MEKIVDNQMKENCAVTHDIEAIEQRLDVVDHRLDKHGRELDELRTKIAVTTAILERIDTTVLKIDAKFDELKETPGKRWELIIGQIITILVASFMAYYMTRLGMPTPI